MSAGNNLIWIGAGLLGLALLAPALQPGDERPPPPAAPAPSAAPPPLAAAGNGAARREIVRAADGHFYVDALVNGARITFLVDTGASVVALTTADAQRAGIVRPAERATARGAGGEVELMPVTIERIAAGPLEARNVPGAIVPRLQVSLLGQSFLGRVGTVEISGDRMMLR